ncbi:MAG TPA: hypothetical protein VN920_08395 [Pyrinomonadaceae bacterium]|nr:hypothetical protein [Pyrinomonadaceae bacterium]
MTSVKLKTAMVFFFAGAGVACALFNIPRDFGPIGIDIVQRSDECDRNGRRTTRTLRLLRR